ncbi:asparagine synthetase domain-containing protein 1 [Purpureocillium lavendulum]|uniref:Asparagine synthetase domain-containing protein 1 n=1 Tax=Purpureocillium lavendulum TaxID=1247861 RepID=A0AB34G3A3_9HYPO|nr:asparagine synthetase domain-containing protein 1 [Purpureocillium lavendulum]
MLGDTAPARSADVSAVKQQWHKGALAGGDTQRRGWVLNSTSGPAMEGQVPAQVHISTSILRATSEGSDPRPGLRVSSHTALTPSSHPSICRPNTRHRPLLALIAPRASMCGIHATISRSGYRTPSLALEKRLRSRGPDHCGTVRTCLDWPGGTLLYLTFTSTVLSLRGDHVARQPLVDESTGSVLCWNGEAWKLRGRPVQGNDGEAILAELVAASCHSTIESCDGVLHALRQIEGPFAFIFLDKPAGRIYYGRDRLGRRSLLAEAADGLSLSSVAESPSQSWVEVEADGCYTLDLDAELVPIRRDWADDDQLVSSLGVFNANIPTTQVKLTRSAPSVKCLQNHLVESLKYRVLNVPVPPRASSTDARIAILFSGGLDCTVLARLASELLPPDQAIDLINVAFENPRIAAQNKTISKEGLYELCPDRITARKSFAELVDVCPTRRWRLVCVSGQCVMDANRALTEDQVNVPFSLTTSNRSEVIDLIYPHNTEMDLSIAYALYFAARGRGLSQNSPESEPRPYETTARVLLSGLGADELFGGYIRHATAFSRRGYEGLNDELKLDVGRLGKRNLGRDDRVMAHWEREVRFPYLDEDLVKWAIEVPVWEKCDFENQDVDGQVEPGKRILRLLAQELGMDAVAVEKKRAIQFGARTAKMESGKVKGTTLIT